ncbi:hypothetical protein [Rhizobium sp. LCM 4573]|uniref:hypothetical protein n=1 Tax=Rhizobium sp. LCM 4573 TaxID=1848291 RepID=UPI0010427E7E|nr:hypothetical protein [Rhizobium sp. LCM 4573]
MVIVITKKRMVFSTIGTLHSGSFQASLKTNPRTSRKRMDVTIIINHMALPPNLPGYVATAFGAVPSHAAADALHIGTAE